MPPMDWQYLLLLVFRIAAFSVSHFLIESHHSLLLINVLFIKHLYFMAKMEIDILNSIYINPSRVDVFLNAF